MKLKLSLFFFFKQRTKIEIKLIPWNFRTWNWMFLLQCLNHVYIFLCTRYEIMVNLSFTLLCSTCKSLTFKKIIFYSSVYFLLTHLKFWINVPHWIYHLNINKVHIPTNVKFFRLHTSFNMVKDQPKPLYQLWRQDHIEVCFINCEGKITLKVVLSIVKARSHWSLFCRNARVVELGFIENSCACFILNPFSLVDQHQVDIPCSRCLGTISHIKGVQVWKPSLWLTYI